MRWEKPGKDDLKLNVDASFHSDVGMGATASIARDGHGKFVAAPCTFIPYVSEASTVEAMAMKHGLTLAATLGFNTSIVAESDSTDVISACKGSTWWSEGAPIFGDCMDLIASIGNVNFNHCLQEAHVKFQ